jgi:hypothetical protein
MPSKIIPFYVRCVLDWHAFFRSQWTLSSTAPTEQNCDKNILTASRGLVYTWI